MAMAAMIVALVGAGGIVAGGVGLWSMRRNGRGSGQEPFRVDAAGTYVRRAAITEAAVNAPALGVAPDSFIILKEGEQLPPVPISDLPARVAALEEFVVDLRCQIAAASDIIAPQSRGEPERDDRGTL